MPICTVCKKPFVYNDEVGYSRDICSPYCDGVNDERHRQLKRIPHDAICISKDGDKMRCVFGDFIKLQESPAGFGDDFAEALADLGLQAKREVTL